LFLNGGAIQDPGRRLRRNTAGIVKAEAAITGGYRMECKIPWSTIGVSAFASDNIGLDIAYSNYMVAGARDNKLFWFSTTDNDWTNPSLFGTAKLMPGPAASAQYRTGLAQRRASAQVALTGTRVRAQPATTCCGRTVSGGGYASVANRNRHDQLYEHGPDATARRTTSW